MAKLTHQEFEQLSRLIIELAGIQLDPGKEYLMEARLEPVLNLCGFDSYTELYRAAMRDTKGDIKAKIVDAITINETYFFRDQVPFDLLKNKIVPEMIDQKVRQSRGHKPSLRIWSAACSTGQEVYSIAMTLKEMFLDETSLDISILGTDISGVAVAKASYGKYNQFEVERGLTPYFLNKYFFRTDGQWRIKDQLRSWVHFSKIDLNHSFHGLGTFDIVFCRNVAIYFPMHGKVKLFEKIADILTPNGALLVGGSESLAGIAPAFTPQHYLKGVFYQKPQQNRKDGIAGDLPMVEELPQMQSAPLTVPVKPVEPVRVKLPPIPPKSAANERIALRKQQIQKEEAVLEKRKIKEHSAPVSQSDQVVPSEPVSEQEEVGESLLNRIQSQRKGNKPGFLKGKADKAQQRKTLLERLKEQDDPES